VVIWALACIEVLACHHPEPAPDEDEDPAGVALDPFADLPDDADTGPSVLVDCAGAGDYATIGEAIAASAPGTHIGLAPCTYRENLDFHGKALDIHGITGPEDTIVEGTGGAAVVTAIHGESEGTRLAGVTVTGGAWNFPSAVYASSSYLTMENVVFAGNTGTGALIFASGALLDMTDVTIEDHASGTSIYLDNGSTIARRLHLSCDNAGYGMYVHDALVLLDSDVTCGTTAGLFLDGGEANIQRSRVESAGTAVYGLDLPDTRNERLWIRNSVFVGGDTGVYTRYMHVKADNDVFWGGRIGLDLQDAHIESYVYDSVGVGSVCGIQTDGTTAYAQAWNAVSVDAPCGLVGGALAGDPGFVDGPADVHLADGSPLIDAGDPDGKDDDGSRTDIGAFGGKAEPE
jgi:hypothetical protein